MIFLAVKSFCFLACRAMRFAQGGSRWEAEEAGGKSVLARGQQEPGRKEGCVVGREQATGHPSPKSKLLVSEGCLLFWCSCAQEFSESIGNEIVCRGLFGTVAMYA